MTGRVVVVVLVAALAGCGRIGFDATSNTQDGGDGDADVVVDAPDPHCMVQISVGDDFICTRMGDGSLWCWGRDENGQIGNGIIIDAAQAPARVLPGPYVDLGTGGNHTCALAADQSVECWGNNGNRQCKPLTGDSAVPATTNIAALGLAIGGSHSCAVVGGGTAMCWGDADGGQFATGSAPDLYATPTMVGQTGIQRMFSGEDHVCAVTVGGLRCWGINSQGQLGVDPATTPSLCQDVGSSMVPCSTVPITVAGLPPIVDVALGRTHTCAVGNDQKVYCWGGNSAGGLGDGSMINRSTPMTVPGVLATSVVAGDDYTCALTTSSEVSCWGENNNGELASGNQVDRPTPALIGLTGVREISSASSGSTVCARTDDGLYCWGRNTYNVAGDTAGMNIVTPRLVMTACP